jgi:UDP-N-acetyl-D-glucosamine dehydrogenase
VSQVAPIEDRFGAAADGSKLVVVGQGYVGLPLAIRAVACGYRVVGHDVDERRVKALLSGQSFVEDVSNPDLVEALDSALYLPTTEARDCAGFDVALITVPTPLKEGAPDLSYIRQAATMLSRFLQPGATVVLESTTYPGTTEDVVAPILEEGSGLLAGSDFHLGYSPERIDPGNRANPFWSTPKVVSGIDSMSLAATTAFYSRLVDRTVPVSSPKVAELTKLLENTFRHVNIALVNELAMFASSLEIDVWEAIDAASTKPFGYMRFTPGPGVGGHCLPIDPSYLSWRVMRSLGRSFRFVELANDINSHMPDYVVTRISHSLNRRRLAVNGSRVLLLGLSYKPNTGDERESPATVVARRLLTQGAVVHACDAHVVETHLDGGVERVELTPQEVRSADLVVLLTDHDDFDYQMVVAEAGEILDARHRLEGPNVEHL